ncbi:UDP-glucoronosyl and UDP-glucosyl transferase [Trypanosoma theileri]|uniref:UDP-glucoronosyl and UDP-glucosyl transferase n=1 Tax=Trypanosoma theileri TaxID=67003 RepID=A0A1X0NQB7_9TRYP|nr:UDP-glucoronosyl and UDP-glucosyl transferase [Trypanosoma theileri]ORC86330.1 UDP-glucoronosyl and UDP-glucosyl transferase [Trypanosoma theileri]
MKQIKRLEEGIIVSSPLGVNFCCLVVLVLLLGPVNLLAFTVTAAGNSEKVNVSEPFSPLHVAIVSIPLHGHFKPLQIIGEEFTRRGHRVTYFIENQNWCKKLVQIKDMVKCIVLPSYNVFSENFFRNLSQLDNTLASLPELFVEISRHHELHLGDYLTAVKEVHAAHPLSMIISDVSTFVGGSVATALSIPSVTFLPLTTMIPLGVSSQIPIMGTGWPARMNEWQRMANFGIKALLAIVPDKLDSVNTVRSLYGIKPIKDGFELGGWYDTIMAPTLWGFDIPHEVCPNFHPLGLLSFHEARTSPMEKELAVFLDKCQVGSIYVNFGTLVELSPFLGERIVKALRQLPYCIVWKLKDSEKQSILKYLGEIKERSFFSHFFISPFNIMRHKNTVTFLSHCGDASIHEAIDAKLPIVGIPFFADQVDVCQRVEESKIGKCLGEKNSFTSESLAKTIRHVVVNLHQMRNNMEYLLRISKFLGGAERAVDILESRQRNHLLGRNETLERCVIFNEELETKLQPLFIRVAQLDVFLVWFIVFLPLWFPIFICAEKVILCIKMILCGRVAHTKFRPRRFMAKSRSLQLEVN